MIKKKNQLIMMENNFLLMKKYLLKKTWIPYKRDEISGGHWEVPFLQLFPLTFIYETLKRGKTGKG